MQVSEGPQPTTAVIDAPATADEGTQVLFSGANSKPGTGETITAYDWDFGDLTPHVITPNDSVLHTYGHAGDYTVGLVVSADGPSNAFDTHDITILNVAPTLFLLTADMLSLFEGTAITITGDFTDPSWLDVHTGDLDCGSPDAIPFGPFVVEEHAEPDSTGSIFGQCIYGHAGVFTVTMTVTDDLGSGDAEQLVLNVANVAPTLFPLDVGPLPALEGSTLTITGDFTDPSWLDTHTATGDCGDNGTIVGGPTVNEQHTPPLGTGTVTMQCFYSDDGTPTVEVIVTDDVGDSDTQDRALIVENVAPTIDNIAAVPDTVNEGNSSTITVDATDPAGPNDQLLYSFDCNDDDIFEVAPQTGNSTICFFPDGSIHRVNVEVDDQDGGVTPGFINVNVDDVPPALVISGDSSTDEGSTYTLSLASTDAGDDTIQNWTITWGDGNVDTVSGDAVTADHIYTDGPDNHTISATASDEEGGPYPSNSFNIQVNNVAPYYY